MAGAQKLKSITCRKFRGLNVVDDPSVIDISESPYMPNMDITHDGGAQTRYGYEEVADLSSGSLNGSGRSWGLNSFYATYGSYKGDYLLVCNNGKLFAIKDNDFDTITEVGSYGSDDAKVRGVTHLNYFIFGDGNNGGLSAKAYNGNTIANIGGSLLGKYFGVFQSRLFLSPENSYNIYYSDINTTDTNISTNFITVAEGNGEDVTGFVANLDFLQVFKNDSIHGVNWNFDSSYNIVAPQLQQIISTQGGAAAASSIQAIYGYTYFLSRHGFQSYGASQDRITANLPLPLSFVIQPITDLINLNASDEVSSVFFNNKYIAAVPLGKGQTISNALLIYNESIKRRFGVDNWTMYTGIAIDDMAVYRDADHIDQLYFTSPFDEKIYKFNKTFSDNGFGYTRAFRSKTFEIGERTRWHYVDLEGEKTVGAKMDVDLWVDGELITLRDIITDDNFILDSSGTGYLGSSYGGALYLGDGYPVESETQMYKWRKRIRFPSQVVEGYNMYFELRNQAESQGWKITGFTVVFEPNPEDPNYPYAD